MQLGETGGLAYAQSPVLTPQFKLKKAPWGVDILDIPTHPRISSTPGTIFSNWDKKRRKNEIGHQKFLRGVEEFCSV